MALGDGYDPDISPPDPRDHPGFESNLSVTRAANIFSTPRRVGLLRVLREVETPVEKSVLVDRLAEREYGGDYTPDERRRVQSSVSQSHVPELRATNVIVPREDGFTKGEEYAAVMATLDAFDEIFTAE